MTSQIRPAIEGWFSESSCCRRRQHSLLRQASACSRFLRAGGMVPVRRVLSTPRIQRVWRCHVLSRRSWTQARQSPLRPLRSPRLSIHMICPRRFRLIRRGQLLRMSSAEPPAQGPLSLHRPPRLCRYRHPSSQTQPESPVQRPLRKLRHFKLQSSALSRSAKSACATSESGIKSVSMKSRRSIPTLPTWIISRQDKRFGFRRPSRRRFRSPSPRRHILTRLPVPAPMPMSQSPLFPLPSATPLAAPGARQGCRIKRLPQPASALGHSPARTPKWRAKWRLRAFQPPQLLRGQRVMARSPAPASRLRTRKQHRREPQRLRPAMFFQARAGRIIRQSRNRAEQAWPNCRCAIEMPRPKG